MQIKIKKKDIFEPIKIELTIENVDELYFLWHKFNNSQTNNEGETRQKGYVSSMLPYDESKCGSLEERLFILFDDLNKKRRKKWQLYLLF